jgi:molecular chaperone GrpE
MTDENKQNNNANDKEELRMPPIANELSELELVKKQAQEYLDGWKRAKADYLNLKKEMEEQNKEIKEWLSKVMLIPLLGILDGFDKAFGGVPDNLKNDQWVKGIAGIKRQMEDYLKAQGVEPITAKGEKFDPIKHEAVESVEGSESGTIAEELQKGYLINGEVLRPAKVKVYK